MTLDKNFYNMVNMVKNKTIHRISKLLYLFDTRSKKAALLLVFMIFLGAVLEVFVIWGSNSTLLVSKI